jgi:hypothetical protein
MKLLHLRHTWEFFSTADGKQSRRCTTCGKVKVATSYGGRQRALGDWDADVF